MTKKIIFILGAIVLIFLGLVIFSPQKTPPVSRNNTVVNAIPDSAEIVTSIDGYIYVMDRNGKALTQITNVRHDFVHTSVSFDRLYITGQEAKSGRSFIYLYDLAQGTETQLLPDYSSIGDGGVDWDPSGYIYFGAAKKSGALPDLCRIHLSGAGFECLTQTERVSDGDVSVSNDGTKLVFIKGNPQIVNGKLQIVDGFPVVLNEIWTMNTDGTNPKMVYRSGRVARAGLGGVADPEFSPNDKQIVFSEENYDGLPNGEGPLATAHDIWVIGLDGSGRRRLTKPGPISIAPDWKDDVIIYQEYDGKTKITANSKVSADGTDQVPTHIRKDAGGFPKWIPKR